MQRRAKTPGFLLSTRCRAQVSQEKPNANHLQQQSDLRLSLTFVPWKLAVCQAMFDELLQHRTSVPVHKSAANVSFMADSLEKLLS